MRAVFTCVSASTIGETMQANPQSLVNRKFRPIVAIVVRLLFLSSSCSDILTAIKLTRLCCVWPNWVSSPKLRAAMHSSNSSALVRTRVHAYSIPGFASGDSLLPRSTLSLTQICQPLPLKGKLCFFMNRPEVYDILPSDSSSGV